MNGTLAPEELRVEQQPIATPITEKHVIDSAAHYFANLNACAESAFRSRKHFSPEDLDSIYGATASLQTNIAGLKEHLSIFTVSQQARINAFCELASVALTTTDQAYLDNLRNIFEECDAFIRPNKSRFILNAFVPVKPNQTSPL